MFLWKQGRSRYTSFPSHRLHLIFFPLFLPFEDMQKVLTLTQWFRNELLQLQTPNVKEKAFLEEDNLIDLPSWLVPLNTDILTDVFREKIDAFLATEPIDPQKAYIEREWKRLRDDYF